MRARRSWTPLASLLVACSLFVLESLGCSDTSVTPWRITFANDALKARAAIIETQVRHGGCDSEEIVYAETILRDQGHPGTDPLAEGQYGFFAKAGDADCAWFASGCVVRTLPVEVEAPIEVVLTASDEEPFCEGHETCVEGQCYTPDADVDMGDPLDPPVLIAPHNGWATGSALSDEPRGSYSPLRPQFRWTEVEGATYYQLQVDESCNFDQAEECDFVTSDYSEDVVETTHQVTRDLEVSMTQPYGDRFAWRVRACNRPQWCSGWTAPRYVDVGRLPNDYDGDGHSDIAISAIRYSDTVTRVGIVYLFSGSTLGISSMADRFNNPNPSASANFGHSMAPAGDIDGDGFADLIVGSRAGDLAVLYQGTSDGLVEWEVLEGEPGSGFGFSVAGAGDVDCDGYADIIIGSYKASEPGVVSLYRGSKEGLVVAEEEIITLTNPGTGEAFGFHIAAAGDLDADGCSDFIIGAPWNDGTGYRQGQAFVYYGSPVGPSEEPLLLESPLQQDDAEFGHVVASAGDIDGDGYSEVMVSAPFFDGGYADEGRVFLYSGGPSGIEAGLPTTILNDSPTMERRLGLRAASAGDIDRDGFGDILVGASREDVYNVNDGAAYLYWGSIDGISSRPTHHFRNPQIETLPEHDDSYFGLAASTSGDIDGDGYSEILIGAPEQISGQGEVFLYEINSFGIPTEFTESIDCPDPGEEVSFGHALETWVAP